MWYELKYKQMKRYLLILFVGFSVSIFAQNTIIVSKKELKVMVVNSSSDTLCSFRCAAGRNKGDKKYLDDRRTPEGTFSVASIEDSRNWRYEGKVPHVYGPYFIRIRMPKWTGIGIHGTNVPSSIGRRCSKGCIRLKNTDIVQLVRYVSVGDKVLIEKDV